VRRHPKLAEYPRARGARDRLRARLCAQRGRGARVGAALQRLRRRPPGAEGVWAFWKPPARGRVRRDAGPRGGLPCEPLAALPRLLTARFWGAAASTNPAAAYGFRDQLQDSLAFLYECPGLTRPHLLLCAARQFPQGDAQHWWHPPSGRGCAPAFPTRPSGCPTSPAATLRRPATRGCWTRSCPSWKGAALGPDEESYYDLPRISDQTGTLYDHCARAIRHSLRARDAWPAADGDR